MARTLVAICVLTLLSAGAVYAAGGTPPTPTAVTFSVELDGNLLPNIKGCGQIGSETEVLEFTDGGTGVTTKIPGRTKFVNVVCTEPVTTDKTLANFRHDVEIGNFTRKNARITLRDAGFNTVATYNLFNTWPSSLFVDGLDANSTSPITETVSIVVDGLTRQ